MHAHKVGLVFGSLFGGFHLLWSLLVLAGFAQPLLNFVFWAHMIQQSYTVLPFDLTAAGTLFIITALMGYVGGYVGTMVWKHFHA